MTDTWGPKDDLLLQMEICDYYNERTQAALARIEAAEARTRDLLEGRTDERQ